MTEEELAEFEVNIKVDEFGHWHWLGRVDEKGRGVMRIGNDFVGTHLVAWRHWVGEVPEGKELAHWQKDDRCANWLHVRPLTHSQNMMEVHGTLDVCPNGHDRHVHGKGSQSGCRACIRTRMNHRNARITCTGCGRSKRCTCP